METGSEYAGGIGGHMGWLGTGGGGGNGGLLGDGGQPGGGPDMKPETRYVEGCFAFTHLTDGQQ
jgi:hypothetical protein